MGVCMTRQTSHVVDSPVESVDTGAAQEVVAEAINGAGAEPSLYEQVLPYLDNEQRAYLATLTPFARELQLWLWNRPGPKWSHAQLAKALGISPNTVNAWFSRGTRPEGNSYHKLKALTGWLPAHLMALTGYVQEPPHEPSFIDFLLDDLRRQRQFVDDQQRIGGWLRDAHERYNARPKRPTHAQRPGTARGRRKGKDGPTGTGRGGAGRPV